MIPKPRPRQSTRPGLIHSLILAGLAGLALPATASANAAEHGLNLTTAWPGLLALALFVIAYVLVMLEEQIELSKSKPVVLAAGLIWMVIAAYVKLSGAGVSVEMALIESLVEFAELFLFLLVAMTYVNAMIERRVFDALRSWLAAHGYSFRQLFWITGILSFALSPVLDNLTTALVMAAVVLSVGAGNKRFITVACINIVVAANAGGAFSPFGDITTLMVWQAHMLGFTEFFRLFIPSLANFVVPAIFMHFAVPTGTPASGGASITMRRGGRATLVLFALTVTTAVLGHTLLGLPAYFGMMVGLAYLQFLMFYLQRTEARSASGRQPTEPQADGERGHLNIFAHVANVEWDTLLFFYGVLLCIGGLAFVGYLGVLADAIYLQWGATWANIAVGVLSAMIDNIPIMAAVLKMHPDMADGQWLLVTLTAGVGGSLLSIGSAAGVALMGQARGYYTFMSHLKWGWAIALGFVASIAVHMTLNAHAF